MEKVIKNRVRHIRCKDWQEFKEKIKTPITLTDDENPKKPNYMIYRGQACIRWKLSSLLERAFIPKDKLKDIKGEIIKNNLKGMSIERYNKTRTDILKKFKELATGIEGTDLSNMSDDEIFATGRHYGLLTPHLDWTKDPYVAAFFAFIEEYKKFEFNIVPQQHSYENGYVYVWGLMCYDDLEKTGEFEIKEISRVFEKRVSAQRGLFTQLHSIEFSDIRQYLKNRGIAHYLELYYIPKCYAGDAISDLEKMDISYSKLFPDLTGASLQANLDSESVDKTKQQNEIMQKFIKGN